MTVTEARPSFSGAQTSTRPHVAVVKPRPSLVLSDVARVMRLAVCPSTCHCLPWMAGDQHLLAGVPPLLLGHALVAEGAIRGRRDLGFESAHMLGIHSRAVLVDSRVGEVANKHRPALERLGAPWVRTFDPEVDWVRFEP